MGKTMHWPLALILSVGVISILCAVPVMRALPDESRVGPLISLDPDSLDFGDQVAKRTTKARRTLVKNTGDSPLNIDNVEVRGDNPNSFSILKDTCTGAQLEPDRACIIDVTFTPSGTGDRSARLRITNNAPQNPHRVDLKGKGINAVDVQPF